MLVLKEVIFLLCSKRRFFIRALRNHRLTLMIYLTIVPSQTSALKLLERVVHAQLLFYLNDNELLPSVQSAYRQFFLTETAVVKVVTDILAALDRGQISLMGMFDLSAAFDTVDHSILRLEISFGIRGAALETFLSSWTGKSQKVSVHNVMAMSVFLDYGVP